MYIDTSLSISAKKILMNLVLLSIVLIYGTLSKNMIFIVPISVIIYSIKYNDTDNAILFIIFWAYIFRFFVGQGSISNAFLIRYLVSPDVYLLFILLLYHKKICLSYKHDRYLFRWILGMILIVFFSDMINGSVNINAINYPSTIYYYFAIVHLPKRTNFNNRLLNLIIAIAVLQILISVLQVTDTIPRPTLQQTSGYFSQYTWEPGLADVASGTMGTGRSTVTSWIGTVLFLFFLSIGLYKKKFIMVIFSFLFLFQYVTVDSKTALGMTVLGLILLLLAYNPIKILFSKRVVYILFIILAAMSIRILWDKYYRDVLGHSQGIKRTEELIASKVDVVINNLPVWGKIRGFVTISEDFDRKGIIYYLLGYGQGGYMNMRDYIESKDAIPMQFSNITRSRSTIIRVYANLGLLGILFKVVLLLILAVGIIKMRTRTSVGHSFKKAGIPILIASVVFMFLYTGLSFQDEAFAMYIIIYALVVRYERYCKGMNYA